MGIKAGGSNILEEQIKILFNMCRCKCATFGDPKGTHNKPACKKRILQNAILLLKNWRKGRKILYKQQTNLFTRIVKTKRKKKHS